MPAGLVSSELERLLVHLLLVARSASMEKWHRIDMWLTDDRRHLKDAIELPKLVQSLSRHLLPDGPDPVAPSVAMEGFLESAVIPTALPDT